MLKSLIGFKKPILGLEIGFETLKLVQLQGAVLSSAIEVPIPAQTLTRNGIKDKHGLGKILKNACSNAKPNPISARNVVSAIPQALVFTKLIILPKMSSRLTEQSIIDQTKDFFPLPSNEIIMDWQIVGEANKQNEIMVVATPKILVNDFIESIKIAGLELVSLEIKPIALVRALIDPTDKSTLLILDIGAERSELIYFDQDNIKLNSSIAIGGNNLQSDFAGSIKFLTSEILHLIDYYQKKSDKNKKIDKIVLTGGGANIEKTSDIIEELTQIKVVLGKPKINLTNYDPKFATAIGLAMKEIRC